MQQSNWKKQVGIFLLSQSISIFGSSIVGYAIIWYITLKTSSSLMLTISILCTYLPQAFISILSGALADRYNRKLLIILGDSITAVTTFVMFVIFLMGGHSFLTIFLACALRSIGSGIQNPVENAFLPSICPKENLARVNSLNSVLNSAIQLLSPGIGGVFLSTLGFSMTLIVDVITAIISIILLSIFIKGEPQTQCEKQPIDRTFVLLLRDFKQGICYLKEHDILGNMTVFYVVFYFFMAVPAFLTPILVERSFGGDVWRLTANEIFWSLGTLFGGIVMVFWGKCRKRLKTMALSSALFGFSIALLGVVSHFYVYLFVLTISGIFLPVFTTSNTLLIQENVPNEMLGRVFSNIQIVSSFATPVGIIIFGPLGDCFPIEYLLVFTGLCVFVVSYLIFRIDKKTARKERA